MYADKCLMFESSSHISKISAYNISPKVLIQGICPHSLSMRYKTEFAFAQLPDVDSSDGTEQCAAQSHRSEAQVPFNLGIFCSWASLQNCVSCSFLFEGVLNIIQKTTFLNQVSF